MLLSLVYFVLRRLLHGLAPSNRSDLEREAELLVLRHQLKVLSRGVRRPLFCRRDRILLAAASRILPRALEGVRHDPSNPAPVASRAASAQVDVSPPRAGQAAARSGNRRAHRANGQREPQVRLPQDPGRTDEARHPSIRHRHLIEFLYPQVRHSLHVSLA